MATTSPNANTIEDISKEYQLTIDEEVSLAPEEKENIHGVNEPRPNFDKLEQEDAEHNKQEAEEEVFNHAKNQRQEDLINRLHDRFYIKENKFFYKDPQLASKVAFVDQDKKVITTSNDPNISNSLVDLAEAKGWEKLKVTGNDKFKSQVWLEANARGIEVVGYKPTEQDLAKLSQRKNEIEKKDNQKNIIEHVATQAINKATNNPHNRTILQATLKDRLAQTSEKSKLPTPLAYDKAAASQSKDQSVSKQIDLNKERTR